MEEKHIAPVSSLVSKFEHLSEVQQPSPSASPSSAVNAPSIPSFSSHLAAPGAPAPIPCPNFSLPSPSNDESWVETEIIHKQEQEQNQEQDHFDSPIQAFKAFTESTDLEDTLSRFAELRRVCDCDEREVASQGRLSIPTVHGREVYQIKDAVTDGGQKMTVSTGAELWRALDLKMTKEEYSPSSPTSSPSPSSGLPCDSVSVLVVGAGPAGLRTAIEAELLGARTLVLEKRTGFSRNNALHIWPFSIADLKSLGAKFFWGRFCTGLINHIQVKRLQLILLKCALICGVHVVSGVEFSNFLEPKEGEVKWEANIRLLSGDEPVPLPLKFDILVGADGEKSQVADLSGFERKTFQGGVAIGITANFVNTSTRDETALDEFGLLNVYNRKFFEELEEKVGVQLENLVMYHDETHYFVMTPKKESLISKGVLKSAEGHDTQELLSRDNIDREQLKNLAREVANFCKLPTFCDFAKSGTGDDDIEIFDFSRKQQAIEPVKLLPSNNSSSPPLLVILVGDSLIEPFWPQGTGANRALLSALDAAWTIKSLAEDRKELLLATSFEVKKMIVENEQKEEVLQLERGAYKLLQTVTPEDLKLGEHGIDPSTRYKGFSSLKTTITTR